MGYFMSVSSTWDYLRDAWRVCLGMCVHSLRTVEETILAAQGGLKDAVR